MAFELRSWTGVLAATAMGCGVGFAQPASDDPEIGVEATDPADVPLSPPPAGTDLVRHRCRLFATELAATVDTWDRSTELGQWVLQQQDAGWLVDDVEMTVGQKPTGFVQVYTQVCVVPRQSEG